MTDHAPLDHPLLAGEAGTPTTLAELFLQRADSARTLTVIEARGVERTVALAQLAVAARARLAHWQANGAKPAEAVILLCEDRMAFLEAFWAATLGGLIPVPVSGGISDEHRAKVLKIATRLDNPWLFTDDASLDRLVSFSESAGDAQLVVACQALSVRRLSSADHTSRAENASLHTPSSSDTALIQFSSGSTSAPKGVVLTHHNVLVNLDAIMHGMQSVAQDRMMSWMPLTHDMGLIGFHLVPIAANIDHLIMATDVFVRRPGLWLSQASAHKATVLCSPNFGYEHFLKSFKPEKSTDLDLASVRLIFNGAEPISTDLIDRFNTALAPFGLSPGAMFPVYGLAEASLAVSFPPIGRPVQRQRLSRDSLGVADRVQAIDQTTAGANFVSVGSIVRHLEVRIADGDGATLPNEHVGHLLMRGANVTGGYLHDLRDGKLDRSSVDAEGWLDTGDLGFVSEGDLHITGRAKDIVFANGQNLYPHDLENALIEAGVVDAGKLAIAARPGESGDQLCAFVLHRGNSDDFAALRAELRRELATRAGVRVEHVVPVPRIPKTTSGKIQRFRLVEDFRDGAFDAALAELPAEVSADLSVDGAEEPVDQQSTAHDSAQVPVSDASSQSASGSISEQLLALCNARISDRNVATQDNLFELGISSLTLAEIHADIESGWPDTLDITDLFDYPTVAEIAVVLEQRTQERAASSSTPEGVGA